MIVGITGQAEAGKDTVADHLVAKHGFVKVAFADPMKRYCKEVFDFTNDQLWGPSELRNEPDWRYPRSKEARSDPAGQKARLLGTRQRMVKKEWLRLAGDHFLTPRYALQTLGTEWGRACWQDVWATYTMRIARELFANPKLGYLSNQGVFRSIDPSDTWPKVNGIVIPDMRFFNELRVVKAEQGVAWRILRPGYDGEVGIVGHASEEEQKLIRDDDLDVIFQNDGTLSDLFSKVDHFVEELRAA